MRSCIQKYSFENHAFAINDRAVLIRTAAPAPPPSALLSLLVLGAGQAATTWLLRMPRGLPKCKHNGRSPATGREDQAEAQPRDD
jgi:hypothetical protein